jgi:hypothetical protein
MKHIKLILFAMTLCVVALFAMPEVKAAVIYSDSSSGTTTETMYVSYTGAEDFIYVAPGASYSFECEAHDDGYNEWTLSVTDSSGTYTCHAWNNRNVFMSDGRDTYWAVIGNEPEIAYFYFNYVMPPLPPPPEG